MRAEAEDFLVVVPGRRVVVGRPQLRDQHLERDMRKRVRACLHDFPGYAKIRRVSLALEPWSVDNGLMTPTLKVKRAAVLEHHREQVEGMYAGEV